MWRALILITMSSALMTDYNGNSLFQSNTPDTVNLVSPDIETFIAAVDEAGNVGGNAPNDPSIDVIRTAEVEFQFRYGEDAGYTELLQAYEVWRQKIIFISAGQGYVWPAADYDYWMSAMLQRWLIENEVTLMDGQELTFDAFTVLVEIDDFDQDEQPEIFLEVTYTRDGDKIEYHNYMTAISTDAGYAIYAAEISFFTKSFTGNGPHRSQRGVTEQADYNADGRLDWMFTYAPSITGRDGTSGMSPNRTRYVVTWQDDRLQLLFRAGSNDQIENADDDSPLEVVFTRSNVDNWGCGYHTRFITDWNGIEYIFSSIEDVPSDCTARNAEEAMWAWDFEEAIALYDQYISTYADEYWACNLPGEGCRDDLVTLRYEYFHVRRILAYALLGNQEKARELMNALPEDLKIIQTIDGEPVESVLFENFYVYFIWVGNTVEAEEICQIAYDNADVARTPIFFPGSVYDPMWSAATSGPDFNPYRAGCDIRLFTGEPTPMPEQTLRFETPMPSPTPHPDSTPIPSLPLSVGDVRQAFEQVDYDAVLRIAREAVTSAEGDEKIALWLYWEAFALEALGRAEEAAQTYQVIVDTYAHTSWAILASIHIRGS